MHGGSSYHDASWGCLWISYGLQRLLRGTSLWVEIQLLLRVQKGALGCIWDLWVAGVASWGVKFTHCRFLLLEESQDTAYGRQKRIDVTSWYDLLAVSQGVRDHSER